MCTKKAEWTIAYGRTPDDYTEACTEHVGDLLTDAPEHKIYPFDSEGCPEAKCCFMDEEEIAAVPVEERDRIYQALKAEK